MLSSQVNSTCSSPGVPTTRLPSHSGCNVHCSTIPCTTQFSADSPCAREHGKAECMQPYHKFVS